MKAYAVQYKDAKGFSYFVNLDPGVIPLFSNREAAEKYKADAVERINMFFAQVEVKRVGLFHKKVVRKPIDPVTATLYRQILHTITVAVTNVLPGVTQ